MKVQKLATEIVDRLVEAGHVAYFAGGWVRDYLMGHPSSDIDIATSALPEEIVKLFPRTVPVGIAFGVVIVLQEGHPFEVATFRKDLEYLDGRKPSSIEISTPEEDAIRRDFTINGMFYDPKNGEVIDFVNGREDLKKGLIRAIGDADLRFLEDRLRMIRCVRMAARFQFEIDSETEEAIKKHAHSLFPPVAMERIWEEFKKMGKGPHIDRALLDLHRFGLLREIFPQFKEEEIDSYISHFTRFPHGCPMILFLMELFPETTVKEKLKICRYLKVSNQDIKLVEVCEKGRKLADDVEWAHYFSDPRSQLCLEVIAARHPPSYLTEVEEKKIKLLNHTQRVADRTPLVSASMLQEQGIQPGREMGRLLKEAERIAIENDLNSTEEVLKRLKIS